MKIKISSRWRVWAALCLAAGMGRAAGIDPANKFAWSENAGWQHYASTHAGVTVHQAGANGYLSGMVWAENIGWIKLGAGAGPYANTASNNYGVNMDTSGNLSGYAWSENAGWVNFNPSHGQVTVHQATGMFDGYAWGENIGWIHFRNTTPAYNVRALFTAPAAPSGVAASQGTYADKVLVAWTAAAGADGYQVWRNISDDSGTAGLIGTALTATYEDAGAQAGTVYYYWIKATNASGASALSASAGGWRLGAPAAPTGVGASDGAYTHEVLVSWGAVAGATSYQIWRHTANNSGAASHVITTTETSFDDTGVADQLTYYYWVKAANAAGESAFSAVDSGYPGVVGPLVSVNGLVGDNVVVAHGTPLTIAVEMMNLPAAYLGHNVDWWVAACAQSGNAWYYLTPALAWTPFDGDLAHMHPAYQGPLMELPSHVITQGLILAPGAYNIWFAVDYPMDGVLHLTPGQYLMSRVTVTVE